MKRRLLITVEVDVEGADDDADELGAYCLDPTADDPYPTYIGAEWEAGQEEGES